MLLTTNQRFGRKTEMSIVVFTTVKFRIAEIEGGHSLGFMPDTTAAELRVFYLG